MAKYKIEWNVGYGPSSDTVEAESQDQADQYAYEAAREEFEANASYKATLVTD